MKKSKQTDTAKSKIDISKLSVPELLALDKLIGEALSSGQRSLKCRAELYFTFSTDDLIAFSYEDEEFDLNAFVFNGLQTCCHDDVGIEIDWDNSKITKIEG